MSLDTLALGGTLVVLLFNLAFVLWVGTNAMNPSLVRIDAKELERRATERRLRQNLGLS
jgi:hypothetical protein